MHHLRSLLRSRNSGNSISFVTHLKGFGAQPCTSCVLEEALALMVFICFIPPSFKAEDAIAIAALWRFHRLALVQAVCKLSTQTSQTGGCTAALKSVQDECLSEARPSAADVTGSEQRQALACRVVKNWRLPRHIELCDDKKAVQHVRLQDPQRKCYP